MKEDNIEEMPGIENQETQVIGNASDFDNVIDSPIERHFIRALNRVVFMKVPDASGRGRYEASLIGDSRENNLPMLKIDLIQISLCDAKGKLIFANKDQARKVLGKKNALAIEEMAEIAANMSKIGKEDVAREIKK